MRVTQLRLAGNAVRPDLLLDRISPELNAVFGTPSAGKTAVAQLAAQLLYGKANAGRLDQDGSSPLSDGSIEVESQQGKYLLRRHRDGSAFGRLSIASAGGPAVDSRTIRSLLFNLTPRLLAELYAVDFTRAPQPGALLQGDFAREFAVALHPAGKEDAAERVCAVHSTPPARPVDQHRIEELVRRRDDVVRQIEQFMQSRRQESGAVETEIKELEAGIANRRRQADDLLLKLRAAEAKLAEIDATLRLFSLESTVRRTLPADAEKQREALERLDAEIGRCRQTLSDLQSRDAAVRRELAEVHPDGTADSAACLADQRATVSVLERLLDDLDAEVSQLARSHEPGRCVGCNSHARLSPVAQMLRQQLYTLCGQVTEQERSVRRVQLQAEARQLARAQTDLSEQLEHLLQRRQSIVYETQLAQRPAVLLPQAPAADHCHCQGHAEFVRHGDAMVLAASNRGQREDGKRMERGQLERQRDHLRAASDALQQEIESLHARWERLQRDRAQVGGHLTLEGLKRELARLEAEINKALNTPASVAAVTTGISHRTPWKASDVLAQLTDGRLVQIRMDRDGQGAVVMDRDGRARSITELTPAENDQAYLALTLALVSSFASRGIDLPLLVDEPFLRQEPASAAAMAGVLAEFARQGWQVIVFTENRDAAVRFESLNVAIHPLDDLRQAPAIVPAPITPSPALAPFPATVRLVRETVGELKPQLRVAGQWQETRDERDVYFLALQAGMADFPVLGNDTAAVFARLGVHTVEDLLLADAADMAGRLKRPRVTVNVVRLWQGHMSLMCFVPGVSLNDAQVLAANEIVSPDALYTIDVRLLADSIRQFIGTPRGRQFAAIQSRFSRESLVDLQKLARQQRERWQAFKERMAPVEPPQKPMLHQPAATSKRAKPAAAKPARKRSLKRQPLEFHLSMHDAVEKAPSIGTTSAERLTQIGVRTVADLLNANPESASEDLSEPRIAAERITRWQCEARLMCRIPGLRSRGARLLVACGYKEAEQIAGASATELAKKVRAFCRSAEGRGVLKNAKAPSSRQVAAWVRQAAKMRPLEAA